MVLNELLSYALMKFNGQDILEKSGWTYSSRGLESMRAEQRYDRKNKKQGLTLYTKHEAESKFEMAWIISP